MLSRWKVDAEKNLYTIFQDNSAKERRDKKAHDEEIQRLYAQIGKLTTQNEWLKKNLASELSVVERRLLVDMGSNELPVSTQASLLGLNRTGLMLQPRTPVRRSLSFASFAFPSASCMAPSTALPVTVPSTEFPSFSRVSSPETAAVPCIVWSLFV